MKLKDVMTANVEVVRPDAPECQQSRNLKDSGIVGVRLGVDRDTPALAIFEQIKFPHAETVRRWLSAAMPTCPATLAYPIGARDCGRRGRGVQPRR